MVIKLHKKHWALVKKNEKSVGTDIEKYCISKKKVAELYIW